MGIRCFRRRLDRCGIDGTTDFEDLEVVQRNASGRRGFGPCDEQMEVGRDEEHEMT